MQGLKSTVALVTGGAAGIGTAIARRLAADGATVVITDIQSDAGEKTAKESGFTFLPQDVSDELRWQQVIEEVESRFGPLGVLVNNAGVLGSMRSSDPESASLEAWRNIFTTNVESVFLACRASIPSMKKAGGGSIVNISSMGALIATPNAAAYGASKAAVHQFTKSVAQHCTTHRLNIRCNSVHPGMVLTPLWHKYADEAARARGVSPEAIIAEAAKVVPMGDFTLPDDVAAAVSFLASAGARHITGTELLVDGGMVNCRSKG